MSTNDVQRHVVDYGFYRSSEKRLGACLSRRNVTQMDKKDIKMCAEVKSGIIKVKVIAKMKYKELY